MTKTIPGNQQQRLMGDFEVIAFKFCETTHHAGSLPAETLATTSLLMREGLTELQQGAEELLSHAKTELVKLLRAGVESETFKEALAGLGMLGEPAFLRLLKDPENQIRRLAAQAVVDAKIDSPSVLAVLFSLVRDPDPFVRRTAANAQVNRSEELKAAVMKEMLSKL